MKKVLPIVIVMLLIIGVGGGVAWSLLAGRYKPTEEVLDYASEMGLAENEYAVTLNHEVLKEDKAAAIDGRVYLSMALVTESINTRFYWDDNEKLFLFTTPTEVMKVTPDQQSYTVKTWDGSSDADEGYMIVRTYNGSYYVAAEFVKAHTQMDYAEYTEPNRVVMNTKWEEQQTVTLKKDTAVRYKGGVKSEVLRQANKGEKMVLLEAYDDWSNVVTEDGFVGWVSNKALQETQIETPEAPAFEAPEYTSIHKDYKINLTWHMVTNQAANDQLLNKVADAKGLNTISPTWFSIADTDGNISALASQSYVTYAHQNGLEVWGLVDNFKEGVSTYETLSRTSSRQRLVNQLTAAAIQYGLDGINVDFETITTECSRAYIEFIRELSIMCRINGIVLSVDNYVPTSSSDHYDRAEQGVVADYVIIMGYDEHYAGSEEAGSVASHDFVERGITRTLEEVPKEKVINAVPFYTRFWKTDPDGTVSSEALGMNAADEKVANNNAEKVWDDTTKQYYVEIDYNGSFYQMWMEEETSIEDKMQLIKQYDLAGVASWRLGYERASIWDVILKYVN